MIRIGRQSRRFAVLQGSYWNWNVMDIDSHFPGTEKLFKQEVFQNVYRKFKMAILKNQKWIVKHLR